MLFIVVGILAFVAIVFFVLAGLTYMLTLAFVLLQSLLHQFLLVYVASDSVIKLCVWMLALYKILPQISRIARNTGVHHA